MRNVNDTGEQSAEKPTTLDTTCRAEDLESLRRAEVAMLSAQSVREGWEEEFEAMAEAGHDCLPDMEPLVLTQWEANEWLW